MPATRTGFELQPTLKGQLLELRPLRPDDWDALFAVASDPLIWEQHPNKLRYTEEVFRDFFRGGLESGGALVAIDLETGHIIGCSRFHDFRPNKSEVEIGFTFLARTYWGGRYNGEMKELMMNHAFRFVDRVLFIIGPDNWRSRKAVEKIGGTLIGSRPNSEGVMSVVYEITAETHAARQG
jgi:RimJ/RimL family protein N-acetyltransferase